jgi:bifunctional lysine-specific demethylase and histidyl-hydroxylase NO66
MITEPVVPIFFAPYSYDELDTAYIHKNRLIISRDDPSYFRDVVDISHIDELITSVRIPATNLNLAKDDVPLALDKYCIGDSFVDKARMLKLHEEGATIILRSVEQWSPSINRLRMMAEEFYRCECQINIYVTPPGQKSTPPHWDTHDLVVMQIAGSKKWRLFEGNRTCPLADERFRIGVDFVSEHHTDVALHAGDTLYLPSGSIHEPVAETYSIHVSIGIQKIRWYDVCNIILRLLAQQEGSQLRENVPRMNMPLASNSKLTADLELLADPNLQDKAISILRQKFDTSRAIDLQGKALALRKLHSI